MRLGVTRCPPPPSARGLIGTSQLRACCASSAPFLRGAIASVSSVRERAGPIASQVRLPFEERGRCLATAPLSGAHRPSQGVVVHGASARSVRRAPDLQLRYLSMRAGPEHGTWRGVARTRPSVASESSDRARIGATGAIPRSGADLHHACPGRLKTAAPPRHRDIRAFCGQTRSIHKLAPQQCIALRSF